MQGEHATLLDVDEGRKRVLLIAAAILAARKYSGRSVVGLILHWN
jgi:hypothetical protein